jgi:carboxyl-terminal processing protease
VNAETSLERSRFGFEPHRSWYQGRCDTRWYFAAVPTGLSRRQRGPRMTTPTPTDQPEPDRPAPDAVPPPRRPRRWRRRLAIFGVGVAIFVTGWGAHWVIAGVHQDPAEFALIGDAWDLLHSEYVDAADLDPSALARGAMSGMADAVGDTGHTYLLTPEEEASSDEALSRSHGGVGLNLDASAAIPTISSLVPGAPAAAAGLKVGDRITAVDGVATDSPDQARLLDSIAGTPGTIVVLTIERPGRKTSLEVSVTRAEVQQSAVDWAMIPGSRFALVRLVIFGDGCADDLRTALDKAAAAKAAGLVLDLRGNGGGRAAEAIRVASLFLAPGTVVVRERSADGAETEESVPVDTVPTRLPLVVLVDGDSASASEIVVGALQDAHRAKIVGTRTAGTGTVLTGYQLADGSVLWIGAQEWRTPSGRSAWHVGLEPDVSVSLATGHVAVAPDRLSRLGAKGLAKSGDRQLLKAIALLGSQTPPSR